MDTKDPVGEQNFYRWKIYINDVFQNKADNLSLDTDTYINGNEIKNFQVYWEPVNEGELVRVEQLSLSENGFRYIKTLKQQLSGGGIFATPPAPIKENIASKTDPNEIVLGFFGVSSLHSKEILIEGNRQ